MNILIWNIERVWEGIERVWEITKSMRDYGISMAKRVHTIVYWNWRTVYIFQPMAYDESVKTYLHLALHRSWSV